MAKSQGKVATRHSGVCACAFTLAANAPRGTGQTVAHTGPARLAAGVETPLKDANLRQLRRIEGQVRGIAAMIEDDRYCADIITQVSAVRESLHTVARNLMRNHLKHCAAAAMRTDGPVRDEMINELLELAGKLSR